MASRVPLRRLRVGLEVVATRGVPAFAVGLGETDTAYTVGQGVATDAAGNTWVTGGEPYAAWGQAIATDSAGSIHVGGRTDLTVQVDGDTQSLLTRLSADGSTLEPPTTLGGSGFDEITDIEIDATADLWAAGQTSEARRRWTGRCWQCAADRSQSIGDCAADSESEEGLSRDRPDWRHRSGTRQARLPRWQPHTAYRGGRLSALQAIVLA